MTTPSDIRKLMEAVNSNISASKDHRDFLGKQLNIGDIVAFTDGTNLKKGTIVNFTTQEVVIEAEYQPGQTQKYRKYAPLRVVLLGK